MDNQRMETMRVTLEAAVPIWIMRLLDVPWAGKQQRIQAVEAVLAQPGYAEALVVGGGKEGMAAAAFNAVAEGIAILSFVPGGVRIFGSSWDAREWAQRLGREVDDGSSGTGASGDGHREGEEAGEVLDPAAILARWGLGGDPAPGDGEFVGSAGARGAAP